MSKTIIIVIICALGAVVSYYGYLKKKEFEKNEVEPLATITNVYDMTGDRKYIKSKMQSSHTGFHMNMKLIAVFSKVHA